MFKVAQPDGSSGLPIFSYLWSVYLIGHFLKELMSHFSFLKSLFRVAGDLSTFHLDQGVVWFTSGNGKCNINFDATQRVDFLQSSYRSRNSWKILIFESTEFSCKFFILVDRILFIQACMFSVVCCRSCQKHEKLFELFAAEMIWNITWSLDS